VQSYEKTREKAKGKLVFLLLFRVLVTSAKPKLRKNERKSKRKACFSFAFPSASNFSEGKVTKKGCKEQRILED